jgi:hypothetical protein
MKKIYIIASLTLLIVAGCKKELTQSPSNAVPSGTALTTPNDFTNAILGVYSGMVGKNLPPINGTTPTPSYYGGEDNGGMVSTPDVLSDNLILNQLGRKSQQPFYNYQYVANNTWDMWSNAYVVILRANYIIQAIDKLTDGAFKNNILGEALSARALAHFDLLRLYAKSYTSAAATDPGVPYVTSTDPTLTPSRTPVKTAYDMVVADFVKAQSLIAMDNGVGRLDKAAVEALLSRVYLYRGEWQNSITAATSAIADAPAANALAPAADFGAIWTDDTEEDVLFKVKILDDDAIQVGVAYQQTTSSGVKPEYNVDFAFFQLFKPNDVRTAAYIGQSVFSSVNYNYVKKYAGRSTGDLNVVDVKVIRMGEVYLNRAEAYYNLGNAAAALADLNTLRSNRYTGFVAGAETGTALYNAIMLERRLELAFEGSRFFDIKRLNLPITRSTFGDHADGTGVPATVQSVPANSPLFQLPIPLYETNANPNIAQNFGY